MDIQTLENKGFKVPDDVIVTGYDDILRAQFNEPSITTSAQPFFRVGQTGMETMMKILQDAGFELRNVVQTEKSGKRVVWMKA